MSGKSNSFKCLYYPFSRLLDATTLKYLLLVFDAVTFLDDVDSDWRSYQLKMMSKEDPTFVAYDALRPHYESLAQENIIRVLDARELKATESESVAQATLADLSDQKFLELASAPERYKLPARALGTYGLSPPDRATWQIYYGKIAKPLLQDEAYLGDDVWAKHILVRGTESHHWTLSYEAGSSTALNYYLEAADELNLTPITTSSLHHQLILRKLKRIFAHEESGYGILDDHARIRFRALVSHGEVVRLFQRLFPQTQLNGISFDDIIRFRQDTSSIRREFVQAIDNSVRMIGEDPASADYDGQVARTIDNLRQEFVELNNELKAIRDRLFPELAKALTIGAAGGSALSAGMTFLGGLSTAGLVAASALPIAGSLLVSTLELWNSKRSLIRNQAPSVAYLAEISSFLR
jgi:hypothetical protein